MHESMFRLENRKNFAKGIELKQESVSTSNRLFTEEAVIL
jgi:hypothetical protein